MKKGIKLAIVLCMVLCCLLVYPVGLIRKNIIADPNLALQYSKTIAGQIMTQGFIAQTSYLSEIAFDIGFPEGKPDEGSLIFTLCNEDGKEILEKRLAIQDVTDSGFTQFTVNTWLFRGGITHTL